MIVKKIFPVFLCMLILLTGCDLPVSEKIVLTVCGSFAVPGMFCFDTKDGTSSCNVLERDSFGRILFEYTAESIITDEKETAWVICQKYDDDYIYYYEDMCYYLGDSSEEAILELKTKNDWNEEMNASELSKREIIVTFDGYIGYKEPFGSWYHQVRQHVCDTMQIETSQIINYGLVDSTESSQLTWLEYEKEGSTICGYFLMTQTASAFLEAYEHIPPEELAAFKQENGWK